MRDLRTLTVILALVVVVVLLAPAAAFAADASSGAAAPAAQPAPATPALTLSASPETVTTGDRVRLVVRLGIPDATVQLSRIRAGATEPTPLGQLVTGAGGVAVYRVAPRVTTTYRVDYAGDGVLWSAASAEVTVSVRPRVAVALADRVYRGHRTRLGVTVRPAHPGAAVTVERWSDGAWTTWKTLTLDSGSRESMTWRPDAEGVTRLRVAMPADAEHLAGVSRVHRLRVVKPNPYNVPLQAKGIIVVDISQYTLRFYSHGRLLRAFPCVTGRPGLPTPIGHFKVYARGMWPGGPYGSRIMSYHPPCAIHGTNEPHLLSRFPRNFSHGCTRLYNAHAVWLYDHAPLGTPVWNVP
jgi:lipoprotein-anchoring transpeptidase ErfK/SrfK